MAEYKTERQSIAMVAAALASAIIGQSSEPTSAEAAITLYKEIAAQIYGVSPYAAHS
jgi:hypothetical protein